MNVVPKGSLIEGMEQITALFIPVGRPPQPFALPIKDHAHVMRTLVDGYLERLSTRGDGIDFWVNEEGLGHQPPNRAIYADQAMADAGYLRQWDYARPVKDGECYTVLCGPIICTRNDPATGEMASLTPEDVQRLCVEFADPTTGIREVRKWIAESTPVDDLVSAAFPLDQDEPGYHGFTPPPVLTGWADGNQPSTKRLVGGISR